MVFYSEFDFTEQRSPIQERDEQSPGLPGEESVSRVRRVLASAAELRAGCRETPAGHTGLADHGQICQHFGLVATLIFHACVNRCITGPGRPREKMSPV